MPIHDGKKDKERSVLKQLKIKYDNASNQFKAAVWFLICSFLQKGISTLTTPIFTRLLTTEEYGQYNIFNSWLGIVTIFATLNMCYGVYTQGLVKFSDERNVLSSSLQGLTTIMILFWTLIYLAFHQFWNHLFSLTTVQMLSMLIMIWTTAAFNFWAGEQRVLYKYRTLVVVTLLVSLSKPLVGILMVVNSNDKVTARILGLVLVELIVYTGLYIIQMRKGRVFFSKRFWMYALMYNLPLVPHYLSQTVLNSADRIMIKDLAGESEAGIYSLAYSISLIMTLFNTALMQTISPWLYQKIKDKSVRDIAPVAYASLGIIAVVNLVLILCAPEIIAIFAPASYYEAIWVIPPVAMSVFFMYSYDLFAKFAFYYEKTTFIMMASVIGALLNVLLNYIFIRQYGYIAAGYTTLACYVIYSVCHYIFMTLICHKNANGVNPYKLQYLLLLAVPFVLLGFALLLTYKHPVIRYALILLSLIVCVIFRKRITETVKNIMSLKKNKNS